MEMLVGLFLAMIAIGLVIELIGKYWFIVVPILIGILIVYLVACLRKHMRETELQRRIHLVDQEEAKAQCIKEQREAHDHAVWLFSSANEMLRTAAHNAWGAGVALDQAESEFAERAFAPFWDAVETAVNRLAHVHDALHDIAEKRTSYQAEASRVSSLPSTFAVEISSLPNIIDIADRMDGIVRLAQKDFQFSTIFEQRKTNQLLVHGFGTLASALAEMSNRLEMSFSELGWALSDSTEAVRESSTKVIGKLDSVLEQGQSEAQTRRQHEAEEIEALKDIERRLGEP